MDWLAHTAVSLASLGAVPDRILTLPIIAAFAVSVAHFVSLYRLRVRASLGEMAGAVVAAMSLQWTVARAVGTGIISEHAPFLRTAKGGMGRKGPDFSAFWEAVVSGLLIAGAITLVATNYKQVREINIYALVLAVQSLPFLAAVALAAIEDSRLNSFAFWRAIEAKVAAKAATVLPQSQKRHEPGDQSSDQPRDRAGHRSVHAGGQGRSAVAPAPSLRGAKRRSNPEPAPPTGLLRYARNDDN